MATTPAPKPAASALVSKVETYVQGEAGIAEHTISSWHVNGWLLLAIVAAANVVGVLFHI